MKDNYFSPPGKFILLTVPIIPCTTPKPHQNSNCSPQQQKNHPFWIAYQKDSLKNAFPNTSLYFEVFFMLSVATKASEINEKLLVFNLTAKRLSKPSPPTTCNNFHFL